MIASRVCAVCSKPYGAECIREHGASHIASGLYGELVCRLAIYPADSLVWVADGHGPAAVITVEEALAMVALAKSDAELEQFRVRAIASSQLWPL